MTILVRAHYFLNAGRLSHRSNFVDLGVHGTPFIRVCLRWKCMIYLWQVQYAAGFCKDSFWYWQANPICIWRSLFRFMEYVLKTRNAFCFTGSDGYALIPVELNERDFMSSAAFCNISHRWSDKIVKWRIINTYFKSTQSSELCYLMLLLLYGESEFEVRCGLCCIYF